MFSKKEGRKKEKSSPCSQKSGTGSEIVFVRRRKSGFQKKPLFIVVKKDDFKLASKRNLLRRRIRVIMDECADKKEDYCVFAGKKADKLSFEELKEEIKKQLI